MGKSGQITVTVKFFATLRVYGPVRATINLPEKTPIKDLFDKYEIPKDERRVVILVNGQPHQTEDRLLEDGDIIAIFPPIGGGSSSKL